MKKYILFLLFLFSVTLVAQKNSYSKEEIDLKLELQQKDIDAKIKDSDHSFDKLSDKIENQNNLIAKQDNRIVDVRDNLNFFITVISVIISVAGIIIAIIAYLFNKENKNKLEEVRAALSKLEENTNNQIQLIKERAELEIEKAKLETGKSLDSFLDEKKKDIEYRVQCLITQINENRSVAENKDSKDKNLTDKVDRTVEELNSVKKESEFTFYDWFLKGYSADENSQYELACEYYEKAIQSNLNNVPKTDIANTYYNWANALYNLALLKEDKDKDKEEILLQAAEKYKNAAEINPKDGDIYNNWANALYNLALLKEDKDKDKEEILLQAAEKYKNATEINLKDDDIYNNWANILLNLALLKEDKDKDKEEILLQAAEKYKNATEINPKNDNAYLNWGLILYNLALLKKDKDKEDILLQALEKYKNAAEINPKNDNVYLNWGNALDDLAELKEDKEEILSLALGKYKIAVEINPKNDDAFCNWGNALLNLAKQKNTLNENKVEIEKILLKAEEIKEGSGAYNLACLHSLLNEDIETAFKWLETALEKSDITREDVEQDTDFDNIREDARYKELLDKYHPQNKPK